MINNSYLDTILLSLGKVPRSFNHANVSIMVTYDKHYPGIKRIHIETYSVNRTVFYGASDPEHYNQYIEYADILRILNVEQKNGYVMNGIANYLLEVNAFKKDYDTRYCQPPNIVGGTLPEFEISESNYAMGSGIKYVNIKISNENVPRQIKCILHTLNHKAKEYAQTIKTLKDLYV